MANEKLDEKVEDLTIDDDQEEDTTPKINKDETTAMQSLADTDFADKSSSSSSNSASYKGKSSVERKLKEAIDKLHQQDLVEKEAERLREKELSAVSGISDTDIDFISKEMEMPRDKVERMLREHGGNVRETLKTIFSM